MFTIQHRPTSVEAWSRARLPFEPKGWLLGFRQELRAALRSLQPQAHTILIGTYSSTERSLVDAENVLFYNVGEPAFRHLCNEGIAFVRRFEGSGPPVELPGVGPVHHSHYALMPLQSAWLPAETRETLATWTTEVPAEGTPETATFWWHLIRPVIVGVDRPTAVPFALDITIELPVGRRLNAAGLLKPLFDGATAAMHRGSRVTSEAINVIATRTRSSPAEIERLLSAGPSPLGARTVVRPWGRPPKRSIQWDAADDLCLAGRLRIESSPSRVVVVRGSASSLPQ